jgi:hypothetical protein
VSSYFHRSEDFLLDNTPVVPVTYSDAVGAQRLVQQEIFMQELRLRSTDPGASLAWDIGAFYSAKNLRDTEILTGPLDTYSLWLDGSYYTDTARTHQNRFAAFGDVSVRLAEGLTLNVGLHSEHANVTTTTEAPPPSTTAGTDSALLPQLRLSYQATAHELLYFTAAKGYGTGGTWVLLSGECAQPPARIGEDTLWSYEAGAKSGLLDGHLQLDAGVFHMLWNNSGPGYDAQTFPSNSLSCNAFYLGTPGPATSNGFDVTVRALAGTHVRASLAVAYTDARYTHTVTQGGVDVVRQGEAVGVLPYVVSPWNVTASVEYSVPLSGGAVGVLRAENIFHSRNPGPFQNDDPASSNYTPDYAPDPSTNLLNLRAAFQRPSYDVALFVNNALDTRPTIMKTCCNIYPGTMLNATTFRPRTVGLSASWHF